PPYGETALAGRLGKPYPTTFRMNGPTGNRTRVSAMPWRCPSVRPWARSYSQDAVQVQGASWPTIALTESESAVGRRPSSRRDPGGHHSHGRPWFATLGPSSLRYVGSPDRLHHPGNTRLEGGGQDRHHRADRRDDRPRGQSTDSGPPGS